MIVISGPYLRYIGVIQARITARRCCLSRSVGTGVAVAGAQFVRPRRHCVCIIWLLSHVSTTDPLQRFPTHQLHQSRSSLDRGPRRRAGIEIRGRSALQRAKEGGGNVTKPRPKPDKRTTRTRRRLSKECGYWSEKPMSPWVSL